MSDKLLNAYSGEHANTYDSQRQKLPRWENEEQAMSELLAALPAGGGILDCPFGTGRWNSFYDSEKRPVLGVDLSIDMLNQARSKISPDYCGSYDLREGSVFELSSIVLDADRKNLSCFACIRFLNWVDFISVNKVIAEAANLGLEYAIFGISVFPEDEGLLKRLYRQARLTYVNYRAPHQPNQYVHSEKKFKHVLDEHGFDIIIRKFIFKNPSRKNYFFLCQRRK